MNQHVDYIANTLLPMMVDPGDVFQLITSGAVYGHKRATKMAYEPIIILNVRYALDQGFL